MEEQLLVLLAGRAGEEVFFGMDGLSSLNQHRIMTARQLVTKMLNSGTLLRSTDSLCLSIFRFCLE